MPDFWTHIIGGGMILEKLDNPPLQHAIKENRNLYNLGCQGPDIFYYNDFWPWIRQKKGPEAATAMHNEKTCDLFGNALEYTALQRFNKDFSSVITYLAGFSAHYMLDRFCHPFVNERAHGHVEHKILEMGLDILLAQKTWSCPVHHLNPASAVDIKNSEIDIISYFYHELLLKVYCQDIGKGIVSASYNSMKMVHNILYSPRGLKRKLLSVLNLLLPADITIYMYAPLKKKTLPAEDEFNRFLISLGEGVRHAVQFINFICGYLDGKNDEDFIHSSVADINFAGLKR